uniref:Uncharacterized protein n=1 Tax=Chromera velia CCMP2878 TaxID=1169474 RepID=A0A0G4HJR6_9ALVE|eukprot:Cvel_28242.t1-p1 / transcript=Cvel_28242.t1 / gene=Cvel_28242 / organism=Chromera_velia_CCMP2878 / gene_product=hypothetical protein / transcript_product=hypothetical protein / location=Cvel_scaffold3658:673-1467(-) / protein_length=72 / sequence_SO=supercontig / SO=protein_coding / is_pseudo=false
MRDDVGFESTQFIELPFDPLRGVMQATDVAIEFEKTNYAVVISNTSEAPLPVCSGFRALTSDRIKREKPRWQ